MTIFLTIFWPFIRAQWRYIGVIVLLGVAYYFIYNQGFKSCEAEVALAKAKATEEAQTIAIKIEKKLTEENKKEIERGNKLQSKLDTALKKKYYTSCVVDIDTVRLLNKSASK